MILATIVAANAQFFVEGIVGVSHYKHGYVGSSPFSTFSISISPKTGYWLNDKIAVGTEVSFSNSVSKNNTFDPDSQEPTIREIRRPGFEFSVFGRYKMWGTEKLSFIVDGSIMVGIGSYKEKIGSSLMKTYASSSLIGINVQPAITYDLTDKFSIVARSDFLNLGFVSETTKAKETDAKETFNRFDFLIRSNIFSSLGSIKIGFMYNF